ncbi:uncharacterized protein TNCV_864221 [Trichonephila clavipes]|nr:uncharacterized protein TNCV_864221 [Trichonephila clavipes]
MDWPSRSVDLNPIEHIWEGLGKAISQGSPPPKPPSKVVLLEEWALLPQILIDTLIDSMTAEQVNALRTLAGRRLARKKLLEKAKNKAQFVRRRGEKFHSDCVLQTVKHRTKIMIWSVIRGKGTGRLDVVKGMMREDQYKDVLQNRLIPQLEEWFPNGESYIFMQGGAP